MCIRYGRQFGFTISFHIIFPAITIGLASSLAVLEGCWLRTDVYKRQLHNAAIAVVDEDASPLSARITSAFYPPHFTRPEMVTSAEADAGMDAGRYTFAVNIPPNFQRDVLASKPAEIQLNVDATRMSQAFTGSRCE